jgi:nucleoside-diphosphate-sugar epimerase
LKKISILVIGYTIRESAELIAQAVGFQGQLVFHSDYPDGATRKIMNTHLFQEVFANYQFVNYYDAICKTVDYYRTVLFQSEMAQTQIKNRCAEVLSA